MERLLLKTNADFEGFPFSPTMAYQLCFTTVPLPGYEGKEESVEALQLIMTMWGTIASKRVVLWYYQSFGITGRAMIVNPEDFEPVITESIADSNAEIYLIGMSWIHFCYSNLWC